MAIDRMKRVTLVYPVASSKRMMSALRRAGVVEVCDTRAHLEDENGALKRPEVSTAECDLNLAHVNFILNLLNTHVPEKKNFFQELAPMPTVATQEELTEAEQSFDLETSYKRAYAIDEEYRLAERTLTELHAERATLRAFENIPYDLGALLTLRCTAALFGHATDEVLAALQSGADAAKMLAWEVTPKGESLRKDNENGPAPTDAKKRAGHLTLFVCLREDEDVARRVLTAHGIEEVPVPRLPGKVRDRVRELEADMAAERQRLAAAAEKIQALVSWRRPAVLLRARWESFKACIQAQNHALGAKWVQVTTGYVRERDLASLERQLGHEFPDMTLLAEDPAPDEDVPVSLTVPYAIRPIQMLVDMYGRPPYQEFDPSPFMIFNFLLFFGICFGDVGYGIMLTALGTFLSRKTRADEGTNNFARLLLYGGISTIIFGCVFGSWFGDLVSTTYLQEGNIFLRVKTTLLLLDPLEKPLVMLSLALIIGILNQFYGIALMMYGAARKGDWITAVCDGLLWIITLTGMTLAVIKMFADIPSSVFFTGVTLFAGGAVGLVLTQGRGEPTLAGKVMTGVVSLYGILGSYGCTAFLGDTLSYCRLLALGLTTSIIALCVNMISDILASSIPGIGPLVFVLLLIAGHAFNFAISLLGAFVHAMRLVFVEFFGRFYAGGARPFQPLTMNTGEVLVGPAGNTAA